jgi:hypothetical protein
MWRDLPRVRVTRKVPASITGTAAPCPPRGGLAAAPTIQVPDTEVSKVIGQYF